MRRAGITCLAVALTLVVTGCPGPVPGTLKPFTTVVGATRFDHFSFVNMNDTAVKVTVSLYDSTATGAQPINNPQAINSGIGRTVGRVHLNSGWHVLKAVCVVTDTNDNQLATATVDVGDNNVQDYRVNSCTFWFQGGQISGQALLMDARDHESMTTATLAP